MVYTGKGCPCMWTVVYMAQNKELAEKIQKILTNEGLLAKIRPINKNKDVEDNYYEVLVIQSEVEEAHNIIIENGF